MKVLIDMNLSPLWADFLTAAGVSAIHWSRLGMAQAPDTEIAEFARAQGFIVLTQDLDFGEILAATQGEKPSVVQIRSDELDTKIIGATVLAALHQLDSELEMGALVTIDPKRTRMRLLPLSARN